MPPLLIAAEIYRQSSYGSGHPLAIPRVSSALDLIRALGWVAPADYREAPVATPDQLARFHDPGYIDAVRRAEAARDLPAAERDRYQIGRNGNPIYAEMFRRPATSAGGTLLAVDHLAERGVVHNLGGGTHHGRRAMASGFCYFNDAVLGILKLLDQGHARIAYVDLDAHHGDGVEAAFADDDRVLTISIHEAGRWPYTGHVDDRAGGMARNLPVPPDFNDSELAALMDWAVRPLVDRFRPSVLVVQGGVDGLADDPMSQLALSNGALWSAVAALRPLAPALLMLGGGGYNPWSVARAWAGFWGTLAGHPLPVRLPPAAESVLRGLSWRRSQGRNPPEHWFTTLADPPRPGPVRPEIAAIARAVTR